MDFPLSLLAFLLAEWLDILHFMLKMESAARDVKIV